VGLIFGSGRESDVERTQSRLDVHDRRDDGGFELHIGSADQSENSRQSDASLDRKIAKQETAIAQMHQHSEPSPEGGMAAMDKAVAENELVDMKGKWTRGKNAKHG
jgi:hypothetical protein